mmetsp:Transcript_1195/g.4733  ORF Transcript_1195/g.4733 Transcript_1195/m.4733 type:complete len:214 (-) Transcript_1195:1736-2377(-)
MTRATRRATSRGRPARRAPRTMRTTSPSWTTSTYTKTTKAGRSTTTPERDETTSRRTDRFARRRRRPRAVDWWTWCVWSPWLWTTRSRAARPPRRGASTLCSAWSAEPRLRLSGGEAATRGAAPRVRRVRREAFRRRSRGAPIPTLGRRRARAFWISRGASSGAHRTREAPGGRSTIQTPSRHVLRLPRRRRASPKRTRLVCSTGCTRRRRKF